MPSTKVEIDLGPLLAAKASLDAASAALAHAKEAHERASLQADHERRRVIDTLTKASANDLADNLVFLSDAEAEMLEAAATKAKRSPEQYIKGLLAINAKG